MQRLFRLAGSFRRHDKSCIDMNLARSCLRDLTRDLAKNLVSHQIPEEFRMKNCGGIRKNERGVSLRDGPQRETRSQ